VVSFGVLSTYPPTQCGIATFSAALVRHLNRAGSRSSAAVVRVGSEPPAMAGPEVVAEWPGGDGAAAAAAAAVLNRFDVVVVQHEYGIYGGPDGDEVLDVLNRVRVPVVVVLHTVLSAPTVGQRSVLSRICRLSDAIVVLSQTAAARLLTVYGVEGSRVTVIPHGAETEQWQGPGLREASRHDGERSRPLLLTWGLIGPGKGIEWVIDALAELDDLPVAPRYVVAGQTHPKVLEHEGEAYRDGLRERALGRGVGHLVEFEAAYLGRRELAALVASADAVVLPYESSEQVASGVLIEAVAARRPIVSTRFPHAAELLADGAGLLVPHRDARALGVAIRRVLTEPGLAQSMEARAAQIAPTLDWAAVADRYRLLATGLAAGRAPASGLPGAAGHGRPRVSRHAVAGQPPGRPAATGLSSTDLGTRTSRHRG
jgi:glycosyltransferase involved in cell wall biosynthesis